jgi:hypothetical protein
MDANEKVKAVLAAALDRGGPFAAKALETESVPSRRLWKAADPEDIKALRVWELRDVLPNAMAADPDAALELVSDLLGLRNLGIVVSLEPQSRATADVTREVMEVPAAAGRLTDWRLRGGTVEEGVALAQDAVREAVEARHAIEGQVQQAVFAGVR